MKGKEFDGNFQFKIGDEAFAVESFPSGYFKIHHFLVASLGVDADGVFYGMHNVYGNEQFFRDEEVYATEEEARNYFFDRRFKEMEQNIKEIKDYLRLLKRQIEEAKENEQNETN